MTSFLALEVYLLLYSDDEGARSIRFIHYSYSIKYEGNNYGVSNFMGLTAWRLFFTNDNIKAEMMSPP